MYAKIEDFLKAYYPDKLTFVSSPSKEAIRAGLQMRLSTADWTKAHDSLPKEYNPNVGSQMILTRLADDICSLQDKVKADPFVASYDRQQEVQHLASALIFRGKMFKCGSEMSFARLCRYLAPLYL